MVKSNKFDDLCLGMDHIVLNDFSSATSQFIKVQAAYDIITSSLV